MSDVTDFPRPELTAELTLADGSVVHVTTGVYAPGPASAGWTTVRVPCTTVPGGRRIARVLLRSSADPGGEYPWVYQPPTTVPLSGYLDIPVALAVLPGER